MTLTPTPLEPVGDVFGKLDGVIDLRTFSATFLKQFFPTQNLDAQFSGACLFEYSDTRGSTDLRQLIATQSGLTADDILITDGASQALYLAMLIGLKQGDTLLVPRPAFPAYSRMAALRDCRVHYYDYADRGADLVAGFGALGGRQGAGLIINSPHNPTGLTRATSDISTIVGFASSRGILTILDDAYQWLDGDIDQFTRLPDVAHQPDTARNTLAIGSLGKFLCLPGLRLGFLATRNTALLDALTEAKRHLSHSSCLASERLAVKLLSSSDWRLGRANLATELQTRRIQLETIAQSLGASTQASARGFYMYASEIQGLTERRIAGIGGTVFAAQANAARYCLCASSTDWQQLMNTQ